MPDNAPLPQGQDPLVPPFAGQLSLNQYTARTFAIMFLGLLTTFAIAFYFSMTTPGLTLLAWSWTNLPALHLVLLVAQLVVVIAMSAMIHKLSPTAAAACFVVYSVLTGLTFTTIFLAYSVQSLILVFGFTALYFGGMALFGFLTSIDLSRIRSILLGGLIALVLFNLLMLFIPGLQAADRLMCTLGVVLFLAFTAYDTQKLKSLYYALQGDQAMLKKASIISALELYLDFINLFLYLLRLFGKRRD